MIGPVVNEVYQCKIATIMVVGIPMKANFPG